MLPHSLEATSLASCTHFITGDFMSFSKNGSKSKIRVNDSMKALLADSGHVFPA